jgi:SAM-dependent methyltransferase
VPLELASAERLPFAAASFDLVTALDVLEHLDRDDLAAREIARVLRPGGLLVATVPALPSLWSEHDEALDHRRRYRPRSFRRLLGEAELEIELLSYTVSVLFPAIFLFRRLQRLRRSPRDPRTSLVPVPPILNRLLIGLLRLEGRLLPHLRLPFGVSLIAVARKVERCPRGWWAPLRARTGAS